MTYLQLCQKMIRDIGLTGSISTVVGQTGMNQKIVDWVADADEHIQSLWSDWDFLWSQFSVNTISSVREYSKPADLGTWDLDSFYLDYTTDDYIHLSHTSYAEWRKADRQGTQQSDTPCNFVIAPNGNIYLVPTPAGTHALTADYWKTPTRLSANTDTSPIPDRFERIIIAQAKIYYAEHDEFPTIYELATKEYAGLLSRLQSNQLPGDFRAMKTSGNNLRIRVE